MPTSKEKARLALDIIRQCVEADRYEVRQHFMDRLNERGIFWVDTLTILANPSRVKDDGLDEHDRPKWILEGKLYDETDAAIVVAIDRDANGDWSVFITAYWDDEYEF